MQNNVVTLLLTGDIMLGGRFLDYKERQNIDYEYPFRPLKSLFEETDIIFGNLECTLSREGIARRDKSMALYAPPESVSALKYLGFNAVSLGNNHINDYGSQGLDKTTQILKENSLPFFGAGRNLEEAGQELIIAKNNLKIAFLGYTTDEEHVKSVIATSNSAGCVFYDFSRIANDIERIRNSADVICISLHWGYQYYAYPSPKQVNLAHQIVDAGAHVVIGHHPHVIQGYERYKHGVIFYSLGNFFFPDFCYKNGTGYIWPAESNKSIIVRCQVGAKGVGTIEIFPCLRGEDYCLVIPEDESKQKIISEINQLSLNIKRDNYRAFWDGYDRYKQRESINELFKELRSLGLGVVRRISFRSIRYNMLLLGKYIIARLRKR